MPNEWYCQVMGEELGPLTDQELRRMASQGQIAISDLVRKGKDGQWAPAERVKGLFDRQESQRASASPRGTESDLNRAPPRIASNAVNTNDVTSTSQIRLVPCPDCGKAVSRAARLCPNCGRSLSKSRLIACVLAWVIGLTGAHKFYLGKTSEGVTYLVCSLTVVLAPFVAILAIVDGFRYLNATDEVFANLEKHTSPISRQHEPASNSLLNRRSLVAIVVAIPVIMFLGVVFDPGPKIDNEPQKNTKWSNPNMDTKGYSEKERIRIFHEFVRIEDRFPGNKAAQRPLFEKLYKKYGIDKTFELQLLGEAIDRKWPMP